MFLYFWTKLVNLKHMARPKHDIDSMVQEVLDEFDFETLAIHAGESPDPTTGATRMPLHMATTFKLPKFGIKLFDALMMDSTHPPFAYTRADDGV